MVNQIWLAQDFAKFLTVRDIPDKHLIIAQDIEKAVNKNKQIILRHRLWFLFNARKNYCIESSWDGLEKFFLTGDINTYQPLYTFQQNNKPNMEFFAELYKEDFIKNNTNCLIVIDTNLLEYTKYNYSNRFSTWQKEAEKQNIFITHS